MKPITIILSVLLSTSSVFAASAQEVAAKALTIMRSAGGDRVISENITTGKNKNLDIVVRFSTDNYYRNDVDAASKNIELGSPLHVVYPVDEDAAVMQITELMAKNPNIVKIKVEHAGYRPSKEVLNTSDPVYKAMVETKSFIPGYNKIQKFNF